MEIRKVIEMLTTKELTYLTASQRSALRINIHSFLTMHPTTRLNKGNVGTYLHLREANSSKLADVFMDQIRHNNLFNDTQGMREVTDKLKNGEITHDKLKQDVKMEIDQILKNVMKEKSV